VTLHVSQALADELRASGGLVETMALVERITTDAPAGHAIAVPMGTSEMKISGITQTLDSGAERERLSKLVAECEKQIAAMDARLNNPGYIAKAPPKLVEESRAQRAAKAAERDAARAAMEALS
jgi:valyl-tRNA synthetase